MTPEEVVAMIDPEKLVLLIEFMDFIDTITGREGEREIQEDLQTWADAIREVRVYEFKVGLGGEVGGLIDPQTGEWTCTDCDTPGTNGAFGLSRHRWFARHWEEKS
jgi:hypothetical protein